MGVEDDERFAFLGYEKIVEGALWDELTGFATELSGHADGLLSAVRLNTPALRSKVSDYEQLAEGWAAVFAELVGAESAEADAFRQALEQAAQDSGDPHRAQALLEGEAPVFRAGAHLLEEGVGGQAVFLDAFSAAVSLRHRVAYLAAYHRVRHLETGGPGLEGELESGDGKVLATAAEDLSDFTQAGLTGLHGDLVSEEVPLQSIRQRAALVLDEIGPKMGLAGELLGEVARRSVPDSLREEVFEASLALAEAASKVGVLIAYAAYVLGHSHGLDAQNWLAGERKVAVELPFPSHVPQGTVVAVAQVPEMTPGTLVELRGVVDGLEISDDPAPPKFSSFVTLSAFDGSASVRLRAHMFSLRANGLSVGASCKVRGFVRHGEGWLAEGEVGLDIDRVSLTQLKKQSWVDELTYRMRLYFTLYLDEMNLFNTPGSL